MGGEDGCKMSYSHSQPPHWSDSKKDWVFNLHIQAKYCFENLAQADHDSTDELVYNSFYLKGTYLPKGRIFRIIKSGPSQVLQKVRGVPLKCEYLPCSPIRTSSRTR